MHFEGPVIVGVSGGVDSMTLADMLLCDGKQSFAVAHCNFHLRGSESDGDAEFVRKWADANGIVFHGIDFDTVGYAKSRGVSIEMAARELRYGWFSMLCRKYGYAAVAIAHNANDNAETLILNLVRGTGLRGICGMQEVSSQNVEINPELAAILGIGSDAFAGSAVAAGADAGAITAKRVAEDADTAMAPPFTIWRPLLGMTRDMIEGYARRRGLGWREDRTNKDTEYRRNLIRHEVLPLLERLNPSVVKVLNRDMRYFSDAQSVVDEHFGSVDSVLRAGDGVLRNGESESSENILSCIEKRHAGWRYALFLYLERFGFSSPVIGQIVDLFESGKTLSGKTFYSPTHRLVTTSSSFVIEELSHAVSKKESSDAGRVEVKENNYSQDSIRINDGGVYEIDGITFKVELIDWSNEMPLRQPDGVVCFDYDSAGWPLTVRKWRHGDYFCPIGMVGSKGRPQRKKLSDFFTDLKFNMIQKEHALVVAADDITSEIVAVLGKRIDERVRITAETKRAVKISLL